MINRERILREFLELCSIPCLSREERQVADFLQGRLQEIGLTVTEDKAGEAVGGNAGNILTLLPGNDASLPRIMLTAHMDCVGPCDGVKPQLVNGIIKSDGTTILGGDDKSGVAAIMEVLRVIKEKNLPHNDIQVIFSICEEIGDMGAKQITAEMVKADCAYVLDSDGSPGSIINSAPGQYLVKAKIHGRTAHAGVCPEKGANAIRAAAEIITKLPQGRLDSETTCNVGLISGGTASNIVPDYAEFECDLRSIDPDKLEQLKDTFVAAISHGTAMEGISTEAEAEKPFVSFTVPEQQTCLQRALRAAGKLGLPVVIEKTGGGSDANHYNAIGIPTVVLGTGMSNFHTCEEFIKEKDLYDLAEWVLEISSGK